ncbi:MAG: glycosyltransferase [Phascolarctobacterium sp.]|nr:glycosyltransferase [Phascolarctobacterium sp.]
MQKLYDLVFTDKKDREQLYYKIKGEAENTSSGLALDIGSSADFLTYFNCFSICKWIKYTTIKELNICGEIEGKGQLEIYSIGKGACILAKIDVTGTFEKNLLIEEIKGEIIGLRFQAETPCVIKTVSYQGDFNEWKDLKIGVSICTFKREQYVKVTMEKLAEFSKNHSWLSTLVVDNGSTLEECETDSLRIIHNPNYGGSGGFTRGLLENLKQKTNDYVLLMDDDIDLETSALEHMYALLCGLKSEYKESFLSGAMLRMQTPCIQHENTAYWGKIRLHSLGQGWNLSQQQVLLDNEHISDCDNQYGAWWYCCVPLNRVEKIGLPLPVFVKGDDIEYSLRNERKLIHMNGIGVWHEAFEGKQALWVNYFSDRNMLIMNHYAKGCNRWTFTVAILGRLFKRSVSLNLKEINVLAQAIKDMCSCLEGITNIAADKKLAEIRSNKYEKNSLYSFVYVLSKALSCLINYDLLNRKYTDFRKNELGSNKFWWEYLGKSKE